MSCEYCGEYGHNKGECPVAWSDRRFTRIAGRLLIVAVFPFVVFGAFAGAIYSALRHGFLASVNLWDMAVDRLRKPDPPESA